ncbi:MISP protein, partial [Podargus strigoides]|nr:MISP protein [Podargus strigoides]
DEDEQEEHRVPPPNISPEKAKELEDERREVIRSQAVRKSSTTAERWSSMDELSSINASPGEGRRTGSFTTSFAVSFDKASSGRAATPVDPENIDTEQINFSAARQQFLMLEKTSPGSLFSPGQQAMSPKPESMTKVSRQEWHSPETAMKATRGYGDTGESSQSRSEKEKAVYQVYSVDGSASNDIFNGSTSLAKETKISPETPIEREIRMAMEREENLWKERGIQRPTSSSELVEIQTKPLLSMHASPSPGRKGKDKGRASLYLQREIEQETQREEALRKQGRLLGTYDRGTPQELDERRRVFEPEEAPLQKPAPPRSWVNEFVGEQPSSRSPADDASAGRSVPSYTASVAHFQLSRPRFTPGERSQEQPLQPQRVSTSERGSKESRGERLPGPAASAPGTAVLPRQYFSFSFWKPKVSFVEEMGTQSPLRREDGREEQYRLRTWKPQTSALIEEEIRSDLQREEELQEQRRRRQLIHSCSPVSSDGAAQEGSRSRHSSAASGASGSYSVSGSPISSPASCPRGVLALMSSFTPLRVVGPSQGSTETLAPDSARSSPFEERRRRVKEDGKYAGIEPIDRINTEVVESTRVTRHQSAMAQRWEAGQYVRDED